MRIFHTPQYIQCALSNEILTQRYIHYSKPSAEHFSSAGRCFSSSLLLSPLYQGWPQGTTSSLCFPTHFLFWICPCNWIMWQTFLYFLGTSGQSSPLFFQLYAALNPAQVSQWFFNQTLLFHFLQFFSFSLTLISSTCTDVSVSLRKISLSLKVSVESPVRLKE